MKKLLSTYLFSFFAFFIVATIAPVAGGNDAMAGFCMNNTPSTPVAWTGEVTRAECNASTTAPSLADRALGRTECQFGAGPDGLDSGTDNLCDSVDTGISNDATFQSDNSFSRTLCNVLGLVTGAGGKAFASFAIISLGIGFFTGKVSWGLMIGVAAGIAAMFGAPTIVAAIAGQDKALDCADVTADGS